MNFFVHLGFGLFLTFLFLLFMGQFSSLALSQILLIVMGIGIGGISALVPDVDHRQSLIFRALNVILLIFIFGGAFTAYGFNLFAVGVAVVAFILWFIVISRIIIPHHRGFIHSLSFMAIWGLFIFIITNNWILTGCSIVGFWSHLLADFHPLKIK